VVQCDAVAMRQDHRRSRWPLRVKSVGSQLARPGADVRNAP